MSVTGYERQYYRDVQRSADALEKIATVLEAIRWELRQQREQREIENRWRLAKEE